MRHETVEETFRALVVRTHGDAGRAWLARLPEIHAELADRWRLRLGRELAGGALASVRAVTLDGGAEAVLKVGPTAETRNEIRALEAWQGRCTPRLLASDSDLQAMLLERIRPGDHPAQALPEHVATVLGTLHVEPWDGLLPLATLVRERIELAARDGRASPQKAAWALAKVAELEAEPGPPVLLHGDLDERNLLVCERRGLCAIDPWPCAGDAAYDAGYWVHGNRRPGRRARLDAIVAATGLPRRRVRDWAAIVGVHG